MCMISTEIESVSKTKIMVAPNHNNTRQLTVYSNHVANVSNSNAMVLPVPLPQTLQFIDLSEYKDLFEDCAKCFYNPHKMYSLNLSTNSYSMSDSMPLKVFNVGSYQVSLAMNLEQISRVDSRVFELSPGLEQTLQTFYYDKYWGFIICKLNLGPESYHPLAYSHQIIDNKIYIPTRHYHQEVKWADANKWALGTHLDPKQNPLNARNWNENNIDASPMFRTEKLGPASPEANGWGNLVGGEVEGEGGLNGWANIVKESNLDDMSFYSSNQFKTPVSRFESGFSSGSNLSQSEAQYESNSIARMSSRYDNLKKLNNNKHHSPPQSSHRSSQSSSQSSPQSSSLTYKNIADDWSHSIYLMNLNPGLNKHIVQMNSCKEIWDRKTLFDPEKINFNFGRCDNFEKIKIEGSYPNIDLVIPISA